MASALLRDAATYSGHTFLDDLFLELPTDTRYTEVKYRLIGPANAPETSDRLVFEIPSVQDKFYKLGELEARVKCVISVTSQQGLKKDDLFAVTNNFLHSLISSISVSLNTVEVCKVLEGHYPYKAYLQTLLNYDKGACSTHLASQGYTTEAKGSVNPRGDANDFDQDTTCEGRFIRCQWFKRRPLDVEVAPIDPENPQDTITKLTAATEYLTEGDPVIFQGKLMTDFELCRAGLPPNIQIQVVIQKTDPQFYTLAPHSFNRLGFKIVTKSFDLIIPQATLSEESLRLFKKKWELEKRVLLHTRPTAVSTHTIPKNTATIVVKNVFHSNKVPALLVVGVVKSTAKEGRFSENPFNFFYQYENGGFIKKIQCFVGGEPVDVHIGLDGTQYTNLNSYHRLMVALGLDRSDASINLTYDMYMKGCYLMAWDLSTSKQAAGQMLSPSVMLGQIDIEVTFSKELPYECNLVVLGQKTGLITISSTGIIDTTFVPL